MTATDKQPPKKNSHNNGSNEGPPKKPQKGAEKGYKTIDDRIRETGKKFNKSSGKKREKRTLKVNKTFFDLMGPPPLLSDEDPAQYFALYEMLRLRIEPRDILEEIYLRQIMDDAWLITRYRRMNSHLLNMAQPGLGDEIRLKIDRYRNRVMGSEELLDQRTENLILHDFSQLACFSHPSDMIAKQFEKRIIEINLIEGMISRCLERMRRSHLTLEDFRSFMDTIIAVTADATNGLEKAHDGKDATAKATADGVTFGETHCDEIHCDEVHNGGAQNGAAPSAVRNGTACHGEGCE